jgi:hypothetical protein
MTFCLAELLVHDVLTRPEFLRSAYAHVNAGDLADKHKRIRHYACAVAEIREFEPFELVRIFLHRETVSDRLARMGHR